MNKAVFLDRDGVINDTIIINNKSYPPNSLHELVIFKEVYPALELLKKAGFILIIVTNQPDVGRKTQDLNVVEAIHSYIRDLLPLDDIYACYDEYSSDYKPKPGMLIRAASKYQIDLSQSYMVGDRWRDVGAGKAAKCCTIFIERNYSEQLREIPDHTCFNLLEAASFILSQRNP
ncbi:MAG: HAD family hydrolase [Chlamydiae bacterium CG10_big_fil_rev_8_21_14_0_10_35_9]|nr:MAG: HAD family hydrolase [Chlamydiae bacterium CG10_big_fil_rev_8_21_14_0_10_35_9]